MSDMTTTPELPDVVTLPSGGWARLRHRNDLLGKDVRTIRSAMDGTGTGTVAGALLARVIQALVLEWEIPYQPGIAIPSQQPAALDLLRMDDLLALEEAADPVLAAVTGKAPRTPSPPVSD